MSKFKGKDMDELQKLRSQLLTELNINYKNLVSFLQKVPVNAQFKTFCFQNLDQGIFWMQKGIELLNMAPPEKKEEEEKKEENEQNKPEENNASVEL